jgi:hypothetical protein
VLPVLLALSLAAPARAGAGIDLAWSGCAAEGARAQLHDCEGPETTYLLHAALAVPVPEAEVLGAILVFDLQLAAAAVPPWWQIASGGCRDGQVAASVLTTGRGCEDPWQGQATALLQSTLIPGPLGDPAQVRLIASVAVPSDAAALLTPGPLWQVTTLRLRTERSTGTIACAGCDAGACLVLNSVQLLRAPGSPGGDPVYSDPITPAGQQVTWQAGAPCKSVPVRRVSWGRIRALYR